MDIEKKMGGSFVHHDFLKINVFVEGFFSMPLFMYYFMVNYLILFSYAPDKNDF